MHRLAGHTADVIDLAWSQSRAMLASCSVDNSVRIWDTNEWKQLQVLTGHQSIVRGISWDPLSKFVLSQAEDATALVWRVADWQVESKITEPFKTASIQTQFRRSSWMPDGSYLVVAAAFKKDKHSVTVLNRGVWSIESEFVGHNGPIICCCCNPCIFKPKAAKAGAKVMYCAVVSQDKQITLWSTNRNRPIILVNKIFEHVPVDMAWSADGYTLVASSLDGSMAVLRFSAEELGIALTREELAHHIHAVHGAIAQKPTTALLPETSTQLSMEQRLPLSTAKTTTASNQARSCSLIADHATAFGGSAPQQSEMRLPNGKRRINPVRLDPMTGAPFQALSMGTSKAAAIGMHPTHIQPNMLAQSSAPEALADHSKRLMVPAATSSQDGLLPDLASKRPRNEVQIGKTVLQPSTSEHIMREVVPGAQWPHSTGRITVECSAARPSGANVTCYHDKEVRWSDYLASTACSIAGNNLFAAVGCLDGTVYVYSPAGRRLLPAMLLGSSVVRLDASEAPAAFLCALCSDGAVCVWDLLQEEALVTTNISSLLATGDDVVSSSLTTSGMPVIHTRCSGTFTFSHKMKTWMRLSDANFIQSSFYSMSSRSSSLGLHEASATFEHTGDALTRLAGTSPAQRLQSTTAHLETRLSCCSKLFADDNAKKEWLGAYVRHLTGSGMENKLQELCSHLQGQPVVGATGDICDNRKTDMWLKEIVLPIMSQNRHLQRLVNHYQDMSQKMSQPIDTRGLVGALLTGLEPASKVSSND